MSRTSDLAKVTPTLGRKNKIINGNFDIWQRGASFNVGFTADRWEVASAGGGAATVSRQSFTLGQTDVPNEPEYFLRFDETSTPSSEPIFRHYVEGVRTLAGKKATISFYAKAASNTNIIVRLQQSFGTGGSPSSDVFTPSDTKSVTTSWQKFTSVVDVPSISGKTLGTNDDDWIALRFQLPVSTFTLDIAQVQLEEGSVATDFEQRPIGEELALCQRYYVEGDLDSGGGSGFKGMTNARSFSFNSVHTFPVSMRVTPTVSIVGTVLYDNSSGISTTSITDKGFQTRVDVAASGEYRARNANWTADAEL